MKGFDISYWQGKLTENGFRKAKAAGYDFVIIRLGFNRYLKKDSTFEQNYKAAMAAGLTVGVYYYSTAQTAAEAKAEADFCLKTLNRRALQYPVFIDYEDKCQASLPKTIGKTICEEFCKTIEAAGYQAGIYASYNYLTNHIAEIDRKYNIWLAQYPKATYKGRYELHQYSSTEKVPGIGDRIDADTSTLAPGSYPETVKKKKAKTTSWPELPARGYFRKGDKGEQVKRLQEALNARGYNCGAADGIYGPKTEKAAKAFQKKNRLTQDGLFGEKSLAKLKALKR